MTIDGGCGGADDTDRSLVVEDDELEPEPEPDEPADSADKSMIVEDEPADATVLETMVISDDAAGL